MFLGEIIKKYRLENNLTMDEFASKSGLSKGYISMLEKNQHPQNKKEIIPSLQTFQKVADTLQMPVDDLIRIASGTQEESAADLKKRFAPSSVRIHVLGSIPAGIPIEAATDIVDWEEIPSEWTKNGQQFIALRVKDSSMFPKYIEDDTVIVKLQSDCESGQDCVVYANGCDAALKKVVKKEDCIILQSLNPDYEPLIYAYENAQAKVEILGVIVEIRRKI